MLGTARQRQLQWDPPERHLTGGRGCVVFFIMSSVIAPIALPTYMGMETVPGTASTLKNGDLVQFGTDTQVAIEVCHGMLIACLLCHLYLGFAHDWSTPQYQAKRRKIAWELSAALADDSSLD